MEKKTPNAISLPQLFHQNGYTTISNVKVFHHLNDHITDCDQLWRPYAFDKNDKGLTPPDYWESIWKDYLVPQNKAKYLKTGTGLGFENAEVNDSIYIDGLTPNKVIKNLEILKKSGKPFFIAANFISTHLPFNSPKKYSQWYDSSKIKQPTIIIFPRMRH